MSKHSSSVRTGNDSVDQKLEIWLVVILFLVCVKFVYPLFSSSIPLGYDVGINRYLLLKYAEFFPSVPHLSDWAREHPPLLFYLWAPVLKLGIPVDWVVGWIWNLFCILLLGVYASIIGKRNGLRAGVLLLFFGLLSQAYFDGYSSMYWKNYAGLLAAICTLYFAEKRSPWALFCLLCCLLTHHQTSLLLVLCLGTWWMVIGWQTKFRSKQWLQPTLLIAAVVSVGFLWYFLTHASFVLHQIYLLLAGGKEVYGGAFPPLTFYLRTMPVVIAFGLIGFVSSFKKEVGSPWQIMVIWSLVFVVFRLYFHRRFLLDVDFFLLPFAASAFYDFLTKTKNTFIRAVVYVLLIAQTAMSLAGITYAKPIINKEALDKIIAISSSVEKDSTILVPENQSAPFLLGWMPSNTVAAPGLFDFFWSEEQWETLLFGTVDQRQRLLQTLDGPVYIAITPSFFRMYDSKRTEMFLSDPCFIPVSNSSLLKVVCIAESDDL